MGKIGRLGGSGSERKMGQMSTHRQSGFGHTGATRAARHGFSLLELLAVIAIMALLSTMAVTSYFSAVRGMASRSAKRHFENALVQARQRACMDGVRVSLMAFNESIAYDTAGQKIVESVGCYVVCREIGRVSWVPDSQAYLVDEFADLQKLFPAPLDDDGKPVDLKGQSDTFFSSAGLLRLYNLDKGFWTEVRPYAQEKPVGGANSPLLYSERVGASEDSHTFNAYSFVLQGKKSSNAENWEVGDAYGVEVSPIQSLPKKYLFDTMDKFNLNTVLCVTFEPDGSRSKNAKNTNKSFTIKDTTPSGKSVTFSVEDNGTIDIP